MGSINRIFVIKLVCKDDEGKYWVVFLWELIGLYYKFKNSICLYVFGGNKFINYIKYKKC